MSEQDDKIVEILQDDSKVQVTLQVSTEDDGCRMSYNLGTGVKGPVMVFLAANILNVAQKAVEFIEQDLAQAGVSREEFREHLAAALRGEYEPDKPDTPPEARPRQLP